MLTTANTEVSAVKILPATYVDFYKVLNGLSTTTW